MDERFQGFSPEAIDFLWKLRMNNHKGWMDENRQWYQQVLKKPMEQFGKALACQFLEFGDDFQMNPVVSRMNRDIRFAKDKSPYRAKKWMVLQPIGIQGPWKEKPTFFFEIAPEGYSYGMGIYQAQVNYMRNFRKKIEANPNEMLRLAKEIKEQTTFRIVGDLYKRKMGELEEPILQEWYQRKTFAFIVEKPVEDILFSNTLHQVVAEDFKLLIPFYRYLNTITVE